MASFIDNSGVLNTGLLAHVQSMSVNKVVQANNAAQELSQAALGEIATENVQKESGQVGKTTSTQLISQLNDEEKQHSQSQQQMSKKEQQEMQEQETSESATPSNSPFVGNLLNLKI